MHLRPILTQFVLIWGKGMIHQLPMSQHALGLSWIRFRQVDAAAGVREAERDLGHPTCRNICIYQLHLHRQGILHGGWKGNNDLKPAPLETAMLLLGHTMALSSQVLSWISTFTSTVLMAPADCVVPAQPLQHLLEQKERSPCVPEFLHPLQVKCPFFLFLSM